MLFLLLLIFSLGDILSASSSGSTTKVCFNITIPVTVASTNYIWSLPQLQSNQDVSDLTAALTRRDSATTFLPYTSNEPQNATYIIAGTFCEPVLVSASTILLATHGITLDRYYWDSIYQPSNYSFVDYATDKGYAVFFYDRLGAGQSSKISGYLNQGNIQVAILEQLVLKIRSGLFNSAHDRVESDKIILLGHSYGSILSNALLSKHPTIADGAILTGWGFDLNAPLVFSTLQGRLANQLSPKRWGSYDNGYLSFVDKYSCLQLLYQEGTYDHAAAQYLSLNSWPVAISELLTLATLNFSAPAVTAPVMFIDGEYDAIMCQGYCPGVVEPAASSMFPKSLGFASYIQPGSGHMLNFAYNATGSYQVMMDFLAKNGFGGAEKRLSSEITSTWHTPSRQ